MTVRKWRTYHGAMVDASPSHPAPAAPPRFRPALLVLTLLVLPFVAPAAAAPPPREPAPPGVDREQAVPPSGAAMREAVRAADRDLARAVAEHDEEAFRRRLAPDVLLLGATTERGRGAAVEAWAHLFRPDGPDLSWEPEEVFVATAGDLAVTAGSFRFTPAPADVSAAGETGRYVTVWRHDPRGGWRAVVDGTLLGTREDAAARAAQQVDVAGDPTDLRPRIETDTRPTVDSASRDVAWGLGTLTVHFEALLDGPGSEPATATAPHLAVWIGTDRTTPTFEAVGTFRPAE